MVRSAAPFLDMFGLHWRLLVVLVVSSLFYLISCSAFELVLLHTNDVHARFEEANKFGGRCSEYDKKREKCFGGVARRYTLIDEIREAYPYQTLLLDAGDQFQGTLWFFTYSGTATAHFMDRMRYDAMAIGNHEFDNGPAVLRTFINNVSFPILSCNADSTYEPSLRGSYKRSVILERAGNQIGIVGYTTRETPQISDAGEVIFTDEVECIQEEVDELTRGGVNIIIALGHSGFKVDQHIASNVEGLDLVIGGHTNTFLYTGSEPSNEKAQGDYPHVVTQPSGAKVLVVQDYAFGKYLGFLKVTFSEKGVVQKWAGNPVLLDKTVHEDPGVLKEMNKWNKQILASMRRKIGRTQVFLDGRRTECRLTECNLGNVIADSMVHQNLKHSDEVLWSNVSIAIMNSGGIRAPIDRGEITIGQVYEVLPFRNTIDIVELMGKHLRESLEHSVSQYSVVEQHGRFLQVAGVRVKFDLSQPSYQRVRSINVRCTKCIVPRYEPLVEEDIYQVVVPSYMVNGGDGYSMIRDNIIRHHRTSDLDADILIEYINSTWPVYTGIEDRIQFVSNKLMRQYGCSNASFNVAKCDQTFAAVGIILFLHVYVLPI